MTTDVHLLLVSGSLRAASTNAAVQATVADLALGGVRTTLYAGVSSLPHFNPDDDVDPLPAAVARLRNAIGVADALLFCTPEYGRRSPGLIEEHARLDRSGAWRPSRSPVAWINAAPGAGSTVAETDRRRRLVLERPPRRRFPPRSLAGRC